MGLEKAIQLTTVIWGLLLLDWKENKKGRGSVIWFVFSLQAGVFWTLSHQRKQEAGFKVVMASRWG